jgi:hypothetical protein
LIAEDGAVEHLSIPDSQLHLKRVIVACQTSSERTRAADDGDAFPAALVASDGCPQRQRLTCTRSVTDRSCTAKSFSVPRSGCDGNATIGEILLDAVPDTLAKHLSVAQHRALDERRVEVRLLRR